MGAVLAFPQKYAPTKRRGRKPKNSVSPQIAARRAEVEATRATRESSNERIQRILDLLAESNRVCLDNANARFDRWEAGERATPEEYYEATRFGIHTDSFGEGPSEYMWGVAASTAPPISWADRDTALALAIKQLNTIGLLIRYGGLRAELGSNSKERAAEDFPSHAVADLADALVRLRQFGAVAQPTPSERSFIARARADYLLEEGSQWPC